ncbi:MAG: hypothetical protein Kow0029_24280 [Candidatus Rifleibacteriota bacterium]
MFGKRISIFVLLMALVFAIGGETQARNIVVPTYYGYGVVNTSACVKPYISAASYYPYAVPAYAYSGYYYNYYNVSPVIAPATWALPAIPAWNGLYWYYHTNSMAVSSCNLNVRSEPYVPGKKKNSNVIASLKTGEQVYLLAQAGNWFLVQSVFAPLRRGYVYGPYLRIFTGYGFSAPYYNVMYPATLYRRACW